MCEVPRPHGHRFSSWDTRYQLFRGTFFLLRFNLACEQLTIPRRSYVSARLTGKGRGAVGVGGRLLVWDVQLLFVDAFNCGSQVRNIMKASSSGVCDAGTFSEGIYSIQSRTYRKSWQETRWHSGVNLAFGAQETTCYAAHYIQGQTAIIRILIVRTLCGPYGRPNFLKEILYS